MRTLSSPAQAALLASPLPIAVLVEMDLASGALYLNTAGIDMVIGGVTYYGTKGLGRIDTVEDTPAEMKALNFELSGAPASAIALALTEPVQGKAVRIKVAIFDPATYQPLQTDLRWSGQLDAIGISDGQPTAVLSVTAEHGGIDLVRPANSLFSDAEQQRLNPGDTSLQYMADQVDVKVVWPSAAYFRK